MPHLGGFGVFFFNSPSQPQFQHTAAAEIGLLQSHRREKAPMEICLAPARQAQQMQQFQAAQKVPGVWWHHGKVSLGSTEDDGTEQEAARPERSRFGSFYCQTHGNCLGLLPPSSPTAILAAPSVLSGTSKLSISQRKNIQKYLLWIYSV